MAEEEPPAPLVESVAVAAEDDPRRHKKEARLQAESVRNLGSWEHQAAR